MSNIENNETPVTAEIQEDEFDDLDLDAELDAMDALASQFDEKGNKLEDTDEASDDDVAEDSSPQTISEEPEDESPDSTDGTEEGSEPKGTKELVRAEEESDGHFALRQRIVQLQAQKKAADNPDERKNLQQDIKATRKELGTVDKPVQHDYQKPTQTPTPDSQEKPLTQEDLNNMSQQEYELHIVKQRARQAGYIDKDTAAKMFEQMMKDRDTSRMAEERTDMYASVVEKFIKDNPQYNDDSQIDSLMMVVKDLYNIEGKNGNEFRGILERAHKDLNPRDVSKVIKASQQLKQTVDTGNFTGSSHAKAKSGILSDSESELLEQFGTSEEEMDAMIDSLN